MLEACAPGFTIERKEHRFWVRYNGLVFHDLSTGKHGARNPEVQIGLVRHMIRFLGIAMDCAKQHLEILR
jgi:hypothetical protein